MNKHALAPMALAALSALAVLAPSAAQAQAFPNKVIRYVVPDSPGSGGDIMAALADPLSADPDAKQSFTCSIGGQCCEDIAACLPRADLPKAKSSSGSSSSASGAPAAQPQLQLVGRDTVRVPLGAPPYVRCAAGTGGGDGAPSGAPACDPGVIATRSDPGDFTTRVIACKQRAVEVMGIKVRVMRCDA